MIQLYKRSNQNFNRNGNYILQPISASTHSEINGTWSAEITIPVDNEGIWQFLKPSAVVKMPSHNGDQLYRVQRVEITDTDVTAEMIPIFYDSAGDCFLADVRPTGKTGQQALDIMTAVNPKYSGVSDIETLKTAYYQYKNLMEAIAGNDENSFLNRWGGEIEFDNFTVRIMARLGENRGVKVIYGKNILDNGFKETIDISGCITRIYPVAYNGRHMSGDGYVRTAFEDDFPNPLAAVVEYPNIVLIDDAGSADWDDPTITRALNQTELDILLRSAASRDLLDQRLSFPQYTDEVQMADLRAMQGYSESPYRDLEEIRLGDTVLVSVPKLSINFNTRVMAIDYDSANDRIDKITLADEYQTGDYFQKMSGTVASVKGSINADGTGKAAKLTGLLTNKINIKSVKYSPVEGVDLMRLGDLVTIIFSAYRLQLSQLTPPTKMTWTIPLGFRPNEVFTFYINTSNGLAQISLRANGDVYIRPPDLTDVLYGDSKTYRTDEPMPEL